ncbi:AraC family transcriptional regulator [Hansschlegelia plantiphila]|uniref:AraC family transcriptional regulator n=1 Tax=Hansschlegelia plantiphila TaxID=374655 RepID=A0A9W6IZG4_9HYPH|nr:AraC family transcriptional regulator [Hansschlegelia plantiphila]
MKAEADAVSFGARLVGSAGFTSLFREGMGLVEETAAYLDGDGRTESRKLGRPESIAYATESMRLTTRLMQIASWLLVQRAVNEGEMSFDQARDEKQKVRLTPIASTLAPDIFTRLPDRLRDLVERTGRLQERVQILDSQLDGKATPEQMVGNPLEGQMELLRQAFGAGR